MKVTKTLEGGTEIAVDMTRVPDAPDAMDEWERLEREATAGPWREEHKGTYGWIVGRGRTTGKPGNADVCKGASAHDAALITFLRNRSPQLRAVVEAVREMAAAEDAWNAANAGTIEEHDAERAHDRAMHASIAALKALDEVGHG